MSYDYANNQIKIIIQLNLSSLVKKVAFVINDLLDESSLVLARYARTCSQHQSYGYDFGREYAHNPPARRDDLANSYNMRAEPCSI